MFCFAFFISFTNPFWFLKPRLCHALFSLFSNFCNKQCTSPLMWWHSQSPCMFWAPQILCFWEFLRFCDYDFVGTSSNPTRRIDWKGWGRYQAWIPLASLWIAMAPIENFDSNFLLVNPAGTIAERRHSAVWGGGRFAECQGSITVRWIFFTNKPWIIH